MTRLNDVPRSNDGGGGSLPIILVTVAVLVIVGALVWYIRTQRRR
ncbi:MAG: hypothetical protein ACJ73S_18470 [Mycobacteriales bacterium]